MASSDWFSEARFGMFIHWGLYSGPAGVWKGEKITHNYSEWLQASEHIPRAEYKALADVFNPQGFDADEWMSEARNAGMKYLVITAKHHDGFALWPTKASDYNVVDATPFKRDILGELADACRKHDVKLGFYYSHWQDWDGTGGDTWYGEAERTGDAQSDEYGHPDEEVFRNYWQKKCLVQVRELIENYDPWTLWFDTWSKESFRLITPERQEELISLVRNLSDKCLVNSRIQFLAPSENVDFVSTMDNSFPDEGFAKPWETSGTLNHSWAYHSMDFGWKPTRQLLQHLINNASLGGNYQLNVGPMADGRFQPAAVKRLREIGTWLDVNGEAIYGTGPGPLGAMPWGRMTSRSLTETKTRLYLHLYEFTPGAALYLEGIGADSCSATVLETGQPAHTARNENGITVGTPLELRGCELPVIALDVVGLRQHAGGS